MTGSNNVFLRGLDEFDVPIAHGEGKIVVRDTATLDRWQTNGQLALTYVASPADQTSGESSGWPTLPYPINPNGSMANIAGLSDPSGRILGLMPHPERFLFATQHPNWTRLNLRGDGDGLKMFRNGVEYFV